MSDDTAKTPTTADLLHRLIGEIVGLREDMRRRSGLPDTRIGKNKKHPASEGKQASECPPDVLLDYAEMLEWKADKNRDEGKMQYVAKDERDALICRRWAAFNRGIVAAPERPAFRKQAPPDDPPDTQDSRRDPGQQPATETRPKWGGNGGGSNWTKRAGGA